MITVARTETEVTLFLVIAVPNYEKRTFTFVCKAGNEAYAGFLAEAARNAMCDFVQKCRQDEYECGWRDAKAKRTKKDWFSRWLGE